MAEGPMEVRKIRGCSGLRQLARDSLRIGSSRIQKRIKQRTNIEIILGRVKAREALAATFGAKICRSQETARRAKSRRVHRKCSSSLDRTSTRRVRTLMEDRKRRPRLPKPRPRQA